MSLTHLNDQGRARMVNIAAKEVTLRTAIASTTIQMQPETLTAIKRGEFNKGDVLAVAQVAGIMACKKTAEWIPMCHPLPIDGVDMTFNDNDIDELYITLTVHTTGKTGVEMEALTGVSCAALTIYDMCKSMDQGMTIGPTRLLRKTGGSSGDYARV